MRRRKVEQLYCSYCPLIYIQVPISRAPHALQFQVGLVLRCYFCTSLHGQTHHRAIRPWTSKPLAVVRLWGARATPHHAGSGPGQEPWSTETFRASGARSFGFLLRTSICIYDLEIKSHQVLGPALPREKSERVTWSGSTC